MKELPPILRGDFKGSIKKFTRALDHDSKFALAYSSRGAARLKSGHTRRAITDFNRAIRLNPDYARAHHLRGLALSSLEILRVHIVILIVPWRLTRTWQ